MRTINKYKRSIIKLFNNTSRDNLDNGLTWYQDAHLVAHGLSKKYNLPLFKVVGIMAALSPNNKWERNKIDTELFILRPSLDTKVCTFKKQREKALDIYNVCNSPYEVLMVLRGVKTCNFFRNILDYDTSEHVTVDMWAFRSVGVEPKTKYIKDITEAYQQVANELALKPHQVQAVVWGVIRGSLV